jgi:methyltransferase family protein
VSRDWHEWYQAYDDPASSLSGRLATVRAQLESLLLAAGDPVRIVSMCSGDGRDTLPVVASTRPEAAVLLVELDPDLAASARDAARALGLAAVEVRTADAGTTTSYDGAGVADVLMACGVFGNITDDDLARSVATFPSFLASGGHVVWTRGRFLTQDPTSYDGDPSDLVRRIFADAGFEEVAFVRDPSGFRVGVHRWPGPAGTLQPGVRMFDFV